jgi:hypothetical protein
MADLNPSQAAALARLHTRHALARVGLRLAGSVAQRLLPKGLSQGLPQVSVQSQAQSQTPSQPQAMDAAAQADPDLARALAFVHDFAEGLPALDVSASSAWADHPLYRLAQLGGASSVQPSAQAGACSAARPSAHTLPADLFSDLVLLACLSEAHEGFATLLRLLHPEGLPWPTVSLALMWLEQEVVDAAVAFDASAADVAVTDATATEACATAAAPPDATQHCAQQVLALRDAVEALLCHGPLVRLCLLRCEGSGPWHGRTLRAGAHVWPALMGHAPAALDDTRLVSGYTQVPGLDSWLAQPEVRQAVQALRRGLPCHLLLVGGDAAMRHTRVRALLGAAQTLAVQSGVAPNRHAERARSLRASAQGPGHRLALQRQPVA